MHKVALGGALMARLLKLDRNLATPVALTALFGFPGDFIICKEVATSIGRTTSETRELLAEMFPPMLIGGFVTVTTGSVVVASVLVSTLCAASLQHVLPTIRSLCADGI